MPGFFLGVERRRPANNFADFANLLHTMSPFAINTARKFTVALWPIMVVGWTMVSANVKYSMHFTAPLIVVMSFVVACCSMVSLYRSALYVCGVHGFLVGIYWFTYSQSGGEGAPFGTTILFGYLYLIFMLPLTIFVWRRAPRPYENWQCQACGYPLFRVQSVQCPECGQQFDRDTFAAKYEIEKSADESP